MNLLSLESWPRSPVRPPACLVPDSALLEQISYLPSNVVISFDQLYFLALPSHPNLLPHDQLRPEIMLLPNLNLLCSKFRSLQNAGVLRMEEKSAENITGLRQLGVPKARRAFTTQVKGMPTGSSRGFLRPGGDTSCPVTSQDTGRGRCIQTAPACHRGVPVCRQYIDPCAPLCLRSPLIFCMLFTRVKE